MKIKSFTISLLLATLCANAQADLCEKFCHGRVYVGPTLLVQDISANHASFRGLDPQISLGYADWSNKYYLAAEAFYLPATIVLSDRRAFPNDPTAKSSNSFGVGLLPGMFIYKKWLGYLRFGPIISRFVAPNSMKLGGQLGFGLQAYLTKQFAIRGEYIYTAYSSVAKIGTPTSNQFGLGFIYYT